MTEASTEFLISHEPFLTKVRDRFIDVPGGIRTPDRTLRRRMLYPAELLRHFHSS